MGGKMTPFFAKKRLFPLLFFLFFISGAMSACNSVGAEDVVVETAVSTTRPDGAIQLNIPLDGSLQNGAWSPDSSQLLFTNFRGGYNIEPADLHIFTLGDETITMLVNDGSGNINLPGSAWNKVTNQITFSSSREPHDEIYAIYDGGDANDEWQITSRDDFVSYEPSFSPDGEWVLFESHPVDVEGDGVITTYKLDDTQPYHPLTAIGDDCRQPNWSPANDLLLYQKLSGGQWDIWLMAPDGTGQRQLTTGEGDKTDASFSPDGKWIVYSADEGELEFANLFILATDGGQPIRLTTFDGYDGAPSWSSDGRYISFESAADDPDEAGATTLWKILVPEQFRPHSRSHLPMVQTDTIVSPLPKRPFPQHLTYAAGTIRPNHRSQSQQDDDVRAAYDKWKAAYLIADGTDNDGDALYRISHGSDDPWRTVSEGQGYGTIIVAHMAGYEADAQAIFDGLWQFARTHPSQIDGRFMAWQVPEDASTGIDSAFDGDADIAYGLLLADAQWGSDGDVDYAVEAAELINAIYESTIGADSHLPEMGDWVEADDVSHGQYSPRSSDFMPAHFRSYGRFTANPVWNDVLAATQAAISDMQADYSPIAGLLPDFIVPVSASDHRLRPAPPHHLEGENDGRYAYNAGRDPWRIATDGLLNDDAVSQAQARKMANWVVTATGGNPANIKAGYNLDGTLLASGDYFSTFFAAPFGTAAMTTPANQQFLNDVYDAVYNTREDYYEDSVTLLCLLLMTGNYWDETAVYR